ncbi:MAG: hypothetical protein JWO91_3082, partial [Acidobacteriaceae bacterium]|nr:hypothetical protein [Acidobacteriaceae bacterium]
VEGRNSRAGVAILECCGGKSTEAEEPHYLRTLLTSPWSVDAAPHAPAEMPAVTMCSSSCWLQSRILVDGATFLIWLTTSIPFMSGRLMSKTTMFGCSSLALLIASPAVRDSHTTSYAGCERRTPQKRRPMLPFFLGCSQPGSLLQVEACLR